jgi:hypothetical protein
MMVGIDPAAVVEAAAVGAITVPITVSLLVGTVDGGSATATGREEMGGGRCAAAGAAVGVAAGAAVGAAVGAAAGVGVAVRVVVAGIATAGMGDNVTACGIIIGMAGS